MPLYEYQCERCGKRFEVRQSFSQGGADLKCPACGAAAPRRLFSSFSCAGSSDSGFSGDSGFSSGGGSGCSSCSSGNCASCGR
ncbi:MAG: zinc ribbon domain-containing protein [Dehalococcoidia bacterium]|nr:zinc ribbon domain-containing protein [Dehalococcoidia bacterium]